MKCPKNIKKGLFGIKYEGDCDNKLSYIEKLGDNWFVKVSYCKNCGCPTREGVTARDFVREFGFLPEFSRTSSLLSCENAKQQQLIEKETK